MSPEKIDLILTLINCIDKANLVGDTINTLDLIDINIDKFFKHSQNREIDFINCKTIYFNDTFENDYSKILYVNDLNARRAMTGNIEEIVSEMHYLNDIYKTGVNTEYGLSLPYETKVDIVNTYQEDVKLIDTLQNQNNINIELYDCGLEARSIIELNGNKKNDFKSI